MGSPFIGLKTGLDSFGDLLARVLFAEPDRPLEKFLLKAEVVIVFGGSDIVVDLINCLNLLGFVRV